MPALASAGKEDLLRCHLLSPLGGHVEFGVVGASGEQPLAFTSLCHRNIIFHLSHDREEKKKSAVFYNANRSDSVFFI